MWVGAGVRVAGYWWMGGWVGVIVAVSGCERACRCGCDCECSCGWVCVCHRVGKFSMNVDGMGVGRAVFQDLCKNQYLHPPGHIQPYTHTQTHSPTHPPILKM